MKMNFFRQCVLERQSKTYALRGQKLIVLGNFALIAELSPKEINKPILVYSNIYEWVEFTNVSGIVLSSDEVFCHSKPLRRWAAKSKNI